MPKPRNWSWNPVAQRWENAGRDGLIKGYVDELGIGANRFNVGTRADIQRLLVGSGNNMDFMLGFTGTNATLTSIGSGAVAVGTITNATGIAAADKVFGVMKTDRSAGHVAPAGFFVPTNNVLNVFLQNSKPDSAGSFPATGWDIIAIRSS